ncbi:MAG: calycin-like domain-containing protein [Muribaculaceae bacterium]|nr:calycin-like domain-containing protein [Muribaculaceae bacterium]
MKKIALLFVAALCSMAMMATEYTGKLTVSINGIASSQEGVKININENVDGTYNLSLKNFVLANEETTIPVGNIEVDSVPSIKACGMKAMSVNKSILISEGDEDQPFWLGPTLNEVPINLTALFNATEVRVHIDINLVEMNQIVVVDFETAGVNNEPTTGVRGDLNGDGKVDVSDVNDVINIILKIK